MAARTAVNELLSIIAAGRYLQTIQLMSAREITHRGHVLVDLETINPVVAKKTRGESRMRETSEASKSPPNKRKGR